MLPVSSIFVLVVAASVGPSSASAATPTPRPTSRNIAHLARPRLYENPVQVDQIFNVKRKTTKPARRQYASATYSAASSSALVASSTSPPLLGATNPGSGYDDDGNTMWIQCPAGAFDLTYCTPWREQCLSFLPNNATTCEADYESCTQCVSEVPFQFRQTEQECKDLVNSCAPSLQQLDCGASPTYTPTKCFDYYKNPDTGIICAANLDAYNDCQEKAAANPPKGCLIMSGAGCCNQNEVLPAGIVAYAPCVSSGSIYCLSGTTDHAPYLDQNCYSAEVFKADKAMQACAIEADPAGECQNYSICGSIFSAENGCSETCKKAYPCFDYYHSYAIPNARDRCGCLNSRVCDLGIEPDCCSKALVVGGVCDNPLSSYTPSYAACFATDRTRCFNDAEANFNTCVANDRSIQQTACTDTLLQDWTKCSYYVTHSYEITCTQDCCAEDAAYGLTQYNADKVKALSDFLVTDFGVQLLSEGFNNASTVSFSHPTCFDSDYSRYQVRADSGKSSCYNQCNNSNNGGCLDACEHLYALQEEAITCVKSSNPSTTLFLSCDNRFAECYAQVTQASIQTALNAANAANRAICKCQWDNKNCNGFLDQEDCGKAGRTAIYKNADLYTSAKKLYDALYNGLAPDTLEEMEELAFPGMVKVWTKIEAVVVTAIDAITVALARAVSAALTDLGEFLGALREKRELGGIEAFEAHIQLTRGFRGLDMKREVKRDLSEETCEGAGGGFWDCPL
ncbi:hypothetical protein T439DRAFT_320755 [Meredithblackwellia eburnea MCA 4105]